MAKNCSTTPGSKPSMAFDAGPGYASRGLLVLTGTSLGLEDAFGSVRASEIPRTGVPCRPRPSRRHSRRRTDAGRPVGNGQANIFSAIESPDRERPSRSWGPNPYRCLNNAPVTERRAQEAWDETASDWKPELLYAVVGGVISIIALLLAGWPKSHLLSYGIPIASVVLAAVLVPSPSSFGSSFGNRGRT